MKFKFLFAVAGVCMLFSNKAAVAQEVEADDASGKNMVKLNVLPLVSGKFAFEYERLIKERITVGAAVSFRPSKSLPFVSSVQDFIDDEDLNQFLSDFKSGNFSITPEVRFYTSGRGPFRGFYIAPYIKYATYSLNAPLNYDVEVSAGGQVLASDRGVVPVKGNINTYSAGFSIGFNFKLADNIHLDWRLMGPGYGIANGKLKGSKTLTAEEQQYVRDELADIDESLSDLPVSIKMKYNVHGEGVDVDIAKSPWAGIRSGLGISYRF